MTEDGCEIADGLPVRPVNVRLGGGVTLPLLAKGKVREIYDLGDDLLMVASDRISTYDVVHPTDDPGQGQGAHRAVRPVVRPDRRHRPEPPALRHRRRARASSAAARCASSGCEMLPVECVVRGYITGSGWKDYQRDRRGVGHRAAGRAAGVRAAARADLHAVDEGGGGPRRGDRPRAGRRAGRLAGAGRAAARRLDRGLRGGRRARARARRDPRRHEVRVRLRRRRDADARRRGLHAGLLALLARRPVRGRPRAAVVRQAVRARLGVRHRLGQDAAGAGDPRRRRRRHARALRDRLREAGRRAVLRLAGAGGA